MRLSKRLNLRREYFYALLLLVFLLTSFSLAQSNDTTLRSGNFTVNIALSDAGGNLSSPSFRADVSVYGLQGISSESASSRICLGLICIDLGPKPQTSVTFLLETNLNGTSSDTLVVDNYASTGTYNANNITRYFSCIQDASITNTPAIGIVYAGSGAFRQIKVDSGSSFVLRLKQDADGNKFVIPVTQTGCDVIKNRLPLSIPNILILPFVSFPDIANSIELSINYPIDLVGDFEHSGSFTLILEKNNTQIVGGTP